MQSPFLTFTCQIRASPCLRGDGRNIFGGLQLERRRFVRHLAARQLWAGPLELDANMKKVLLLILPVAFFQFGCSTFRDSGPAGTAKTSGRAVSLFDGKTFKGWEGDTNKTFRIQEGAIVGGTMSQRIPRNEFLCTTRNYTNFVLKLKFKLLGGPSANAGVQFRTKRIPNNHEVSGYQADMGDPGWWGCIYDESRRNKVLAKSNIDEVNKVLRRDDWNEYTIRCEGKHIVLTINGQQTVDYTEEDPKIEDFGVIAVQIHAGPPSEAWYKDITIHELP